MKLTYRGVDYSYEPPTLDMVDGDIGGVYRGHPWRLAYPRHVPVQPVHQLKYRGVAYTTGNVADAQVPVSVPVPSIFAGLKPNQEVVSEVAQIHRENICQRLEKRIQAARARGDKQLLQMLEDESKQLSCPL
jgi:hypothetical protein